MKIPPDVHMIAFLEKEKIIRTAEKNEQIFFLLLQEIQKRKKHPQVF